MRLGSTGEPFRWYISQPAKWGPLTSHFLRLPSDAQNERAFARTHQNSYTAHASLPPAV